MQDFKDKVAVVTGAASGIGRALADRCARESMKIVLADIEEPALRQTEADLKAAGATVLAVRMDVARADAVEALARQAQERFGTLDLLFNNAGVGGGATIWESSLEDWEWILGVNLWGVIHGVRSFVPRMLAQNTPCHLVNTASVAGLVSSSGLGPYKVAKHGVVSLSETLFHELRQRKASIGVSVLCPGYVRTRILEAARNHPDPRTLTRRLTPEMLTVLRAVQQGIEPGQVADDVFRAVREERFYVLTHPEYKAAIRLRMEDILEGRPPSDPDPIEGV